VLGLIALAATAAVLLLSSGRGKRAQRVSAYAFDSRYQVNDAESRLNERVLKQEMDAERLKGGGQFGLRRTHCVVDPPPPSAQRMLCSIVTVTKEVRKDITVTRYYRRKAAISLDPSSGALRFKITPPRAGRAIVTP
jgi:hypothetical protein